MRHRKFGRLGWSVSEVGYGMWGMGGWTGSDDAQSLASLDRAIALGCNFFDTAFAYGDGHSETLLAQALRRHPGQRLYVATKVPPKDRHWPGLATTPPGNVFPYDYVVGMTEKSAKNLGVERIDLQQLHVWSDAWVEDDGWRRAAEDLKQRGLVLGFGISVNRWEPTNVLKAIATGLVDSVQVVYNVFDQNPEDALFPACEKAGTAVIARVPFDEGTLTGTLTKDSKWPEGDWRNTYFDPENLVPSVERAEALKKTLAEWNRERSTNITMPELALRFILGNDDVSTIIPGMRKLSHVESNIGASDAGPLAPELQEKMRGFRWVRKPAPWSQ